MYADPPNSNEKPTWKGSWEVPFSIIFTSIIWWENYVDRDIKLGFIKLPLGSYKRHLQSVRSKTNIGASLWKIALTITFSVVMLPSKKFENAFVRIPTLSNEQHTTYSPNNGLGDQFSDFGDSINIGDIAFGDNRMKRDVTKTTSEILITSTALSVIDAIATVPNNIWNTPTTPNLFDFIATKVIITK